MMPVTTPSPSPPPPFPNGPVSSAAQAADFSGQMHGLQQQLQILQCENRELKDKLGAATAGRCSRFWDWENFRLQVLSLLGTECFEL